MFYLFDCLITLLQQELQNVDLENPQIILKKQHNNFLIEKIVEYKKIIDSKEKQINRLTGKKYTKDELEDLSKYINYF